ncbi:MAG: hypothetical protein IJY45_06460 [Tidjanibacter sp.]|nr:hypothetical protein [Tidjanibacter sp.]
MKRFLFLALLPMLLVGCEPGEPGVYLKPSKLDVYTAHNGDSYRAPKLFAIFDYEHPIGIVKKWETLNVDFLSNQDVFPLASGYDGTFLYYKSPYPEDHIPTVITKDDNKIELYKEFATTDQLFHLGSQLTDDEHSNVYIHAEVVDMTITADVPLFGREAGSNLVDKFGIMGFYELVDFATYDVLDAEIKLQAADKIKKTLLQEGYHLRLVEIPEEQYDKVTFTITIDIRRPDDKLVALTNNITVEFEN